MRSLIRFGRSTEAKFNKPIVIRTITFIQLILVIILLVLSILDKSLSLTDSIPFYIIHVLASVFGVVAIFKGTRRLLLVYLLVYMILAIAVSFGVGKYYSNLTINTRICSTNPNLKGTADYIVFEDDCDELLELTTRMLIRQSVLCSVQALFLHPTTTFILQKLQNGHTQIKTT